MRTITATEASRHFAALLDQAERGETVVVTRGGRRVALICPTPMTNGAAVLSMLDSCVVDADFAADVATARNAVNARS